MAEAAQPPKQPLNVRSPLDNMGQKPALPLGSPALVQHLVFWTPREEIAHREAWIKRIEQFVLEMHKSSPLKVESKSNRRLYLLRNSYPKDEAGWQTDIKPVANYQSRYETVNLTGTWEGLPLDISIQMHNEYFTVSLAIDMAAKKEGALFNPQRKPYADLMSAFATLNRVLGERFKKVKGTEARVKGDADRETLIPVYQTVYYDIWNAIDRTIIKPALEKSMRGNDAPLEGERSIVPLGEPVGDFRGFITSHSNGNGYMVLPLHAQENPLPIPSLKKILEGEPFDEEDGAHYADTMMPFMTADPHLAKTGDGMSGEPPYRKLEHTFSWMHRKRAIYASALGLHKGRPGIKLPVTFYVHSAHRDHWQLGRLVTTLLDAGTTRIAAMFGLGQVEQANEQLREVETDLRNIAIAMPAAFNAENGHGNGASITRGLIDATGRLARASGLVTNGLSRRTERSRYYIGQFERAVDNLAVDRIEGFQPYNKFVQQLFGSAHRFIRMTGTRFERLEKRIREMDEQVQTAEGVKTEKESARYLEKAELFAYLALMPYYVPYALSKLGSLIWEKGFKPDATGYKVATLTTYLLAAFLLRKEINKYKIRTANFVRAKKNKLKIKIKWKKNRKRAKIRGKWRYAKNTARGWKDAGFGVCRRIYSKTVAAPKRIRDKIMRRKPPSPPVP